ncbi:ankyrin repeat domain-containing protein [Fusobacterium watanabei]|uniref:ankyrin repeat domain-containing protein n=1 Tax=Fusobacterium TaxID=848 RepID=UPI001238286F|nr:ankyrin repeat domain-containing protein [Fusobacterium nucleatum]
MSLYDLNDLYWKLKDEPESREEVLEYYRTADIEEKDSVQSSLLHIAAEHGDSLAIEVLLNRGMDANIENSEAERPLHHLAEGTRHINNGEEIAKCAELLLDAKASILRKDRFGRTAVILAAKNGYYEILKVFIDRGLKLSLKDSEGNSALHIACQYFSDYDEENADRYFKTIKYLLEAGLDPNEKNNDDETATDIAIKRCNKKITALLLGNYDEENPNELLIQTGGLSLHRAIEKKDYEAVNALIKLGADVNAFSEEEDTLFKEMTPLGIAFYMFDEYSVKALLEAGADVNLKTTAENTALGEILGYMKDNYFSFDKIPLIEKLLKLLVDNGLKINDTVDSKENTAFIKACKSIDENNLSNGKTLAAVVAKFLLKENCDVNLTNLDGQTALMFLCASRDVESQDLQIQVLEAGADIEATDKNGNTPLIYAAKNRNASIGKEMAELLFDFGDPKLGHVNNDGKTALEIATDLNNEEFVKFLLIKM